MEEIIGSAAAAEAVNRICSFVIGKHEERAITKEKEERMEMALLKIQTAVEEADMWQIANRPLLCWRNKLKRVADEGDDILRTYKQRVLEKKAEDEVASRSFPKRIARAGKRFMSFGGTADEPSSSTIRRFERLADGVGDFLRFVECGGRPKRFMLFQPLAGSLLARKVASCSLKSLSGGVAHAFIFPDFSSPHQGPRAYVIFLYRDGRTGEKFEFFVEVRLSESTDVIELAIKCLQILPPHFSFARTAVENFHRLGVQDMIYEEHLETHSAAWDGYCTQPFSYEHSDWMGVGFGNVPESLEKLPESVLFVVAEWDSPSSHAVKSCKLLGDNLPPLHVSYHLGRRCMEWPVPHPQLMGRLMDKKIRTKAQHVDEYENADPGVFNDLLLKTIDDVRHAPDLSRYDLLWCFQPCWFVETSMRSIGTGRPYELGNSPVPC